MDFWQHLFSENQLYVFEIWLDDWFFAIAIVFFLVELLRLTLQGRMTKKILGDSAVNFITLAAHLGAIALCAGMYLEMFYKVYPDLSLTMLPSNYWTIGICVILADFAYYWEHRTAHRIGLGWATHTVHHSSPHYNISVAYRHGPLDALFGLPFLLPIVWLGFDPFLVLLSAGIVQVYQTMLHTEIIGKFPRFIEVIMNTPSHHRVHHGSNPQYIDKNYAGILIIWDRLFGSYAEENEEVIYGVRPPLNSINPIKVYLHGFTGIFGKIWRARGVGNKILHLVMPPGWKPKNRE